MEFEVPEKPEKYSTAFFFDRQSGGTEQQKTKFIEELTNLRQKNEENEDLQFLHSQVLLAIANEFL
jgi:hypothetical protein